MKKTTLLVGLAAGYVLGTRDGRERYEQIKTQATRLWNDPRVQEKASQATDLAKEKAPVVADKVSGAGKAASSKVTSKVSGNGTTTSGAPEATHPLESDAAPVVTPATTTLPGSSPKPGDLHG